MCWIGQVVMNVMTSRCKASLVYLHASQEIQIRDTVLYVEPLKIPHRSLPTTSFRKHTAEMIATTGLVMTTFSFTTTILASSIGSFIMIIMIIIAYY